MQWRHAYPAANRVFQGTAVGRIVAYDAAPATHIVCSKAQRHTGRQGPGTVHTVVIGGKAEAPRFVDSRAQSLVESEQYEPEDVEAGTMRCVSNCKT